MNQWGDSWNLLDLCHRSQRIDGHVYWNEWKPLKTWIGSLCNKRRTILSLCLSVSLNIFALDCGCWNSSRSTFLLFFFFLLAGERCFPYKHKSGHLAQGQLPVTQQRWLLLLCEGNSSARRDNCSTDIVGLKKGLGGAVTAGGKKMLGPPVFNFFSVWQVRKRHLLKDLEREG